MVYINKTIISTKCITDSLFYSLKSPNHPNGLKVLVAVSTSRLLVYTASLSEGLRELGSVDVNGRIIGIDTIKFEQHDSILLTLDHPAAQLIVLTLGLNEEGTLTHTVECSKMLSHNSSEPSHEYCNSLVDHSTQIGLSHLWQGQLHAFKLSYDNRRKTYIIDGHNTQIDYSVTLAAAFVAVDKDEKATLCRLVLSPDVDNPVLVFEHVVDSKDYVDVSPSVLRIETQCPSARLVVAVPGKERAVLVIGAFSCEYYQIPKKDVTKAKTTRRKSSSTLTQSPVVDKDHLSSKTPFATPTACTALAEDGTAWLVGDEKGDLYYLEIKATGLDVQLLGNTSVASTLQHLGSGYVYLGSQSEDSKLVLVHPHTPYLVELENYTNLAPVSDMVVTHPDGVQGQIVVCSGSNRSGKLRIVTTGIGLSDLYTVALGDTVVGVYSLGDHLLVSYPTTTKIYSCPNEMYGTFDEVEAYDGVRRDVPTIGVAKCGERVAMYQSTSMSVFEDGKVVQQREMDVDSVCVDAKSGSVLVSGRDRLILQRGNEERAITRPENSTMYALLDADHMVYTTCTDYSVNVVDVRNDELVYTHVSPDGSPIYSLLAHDSVLLGGTAHGNLFAFTLDKHYQCIELHTVAVGSMPVSLQRAGSGVIFALCDIPSIVSVRDGRLRISGVNARHITAVTSYSSGSEDVYVFAHSDAIRFSRILSTQHTVHVRTVELGGDIPRSIAHHASMYAVGCVRTAYRADRTVCEGGSCVKVLDETFSPLHQLELEEGEAVSVVESLNVADNHVIAIGTYYLSSDNGDVDRGRFLLAVVKEEQLVVVAQIAVPGCVYAVCALDGRVAIAVNYQVRVYELESEWALKLVAGYGNAFVVVSLTSMNGVLVVADFLKSAIYLKLHGNKLEQVGYDAHTRWSSIVEALDSQDEHSFVTLGSDLRFNLFVLQYEHRDGAHKVTSKEVAQLHENISAIRSGRLSNVEVDHAVRPQALYGTSAGSLCVLAEVDDNRGGEYRQMQRTLQESGVLVGQGRDSHCIIDGDLISKYNIIDDLQRML